MKARTICWGLVEVGRRLEMFKSEKKAKHIEKMSIQGKEMAIQLEKVIQGEFLAGGGSGDCGENHASQIDRYVSKAINFLFRFRIIVGYHLALRRTKSESVFF